MKKGFASSASCSDPRMRIKLETLMEDYKELEKEKEITRRQLEMLKQRRMILRAEVRFLSRRYEQLSQDQSHGNPPEMMESGDLRISSEVNNKRRKKKQEAGLRPAMPRFDLNKKNAVYIDEKEAMANLAGELGRKKEKRKKKGNNTNEALGTPLSLPDLNQSDSTCNGDGNASTSSKVPVFDLNKISSEEEESPANEELTAAEDVESTLLGTGNDELQGEIKLSSCRNLKKELNRGAKRKVSWQDPVALSV